jgi:hypothetical protein
MFGDSSNRIRGNTGLTSPPATDIPDMLFIASQPLSAICAREVPNDIWDGKAQQLACPRHNAKPLLTHP